jgi:predicted metal-dependent peptidase
MRDGKRVGVFVNDLEKMPRYKGIKRMQSAEWYYNFLMEKDKNEGGSGKGSLKVSACDDHEGWNPEDEMADERVKAKVGEIHKNDSWGNVGASEQAVIMAAQTKRIDWRGVLLRLIGIFAWHEREATRKRVNRRTGFIHPGYRKLKVDRLLVVVDTSGSVFMYNLLGRFLALVNTLIDECPIDIAQCDCAITSEPVPFEMHQKEFAFKGKGGTSFEPIMDLVDKHGYQMVLILTDGEASPCRQPKLARVVWITPEGKEPPVDWGIKVKMEAYD